ncbi:MAG: FHA domain-containing protein [Candidatus Methanosuratincola sp.]
MPPVEPEPLDAERTKEVFGGVALAGRAMGSEAETEIPGGKGPRPLGGYERSGAEDETQPPQRAGGAFFGRGGFEEDETQLPERRRRRILDEGGVFEEEVEETVLDREDTTLMGWLIVKRSPYMRRGHLVRIRPGAILGRDPRRSDVLIDDEKVSGIHARVQVKDNNFVIIDLGSSNGTWVNGVEVTAPQPLQQDDEIKVGDTVFVLKTL